MVYFTPRINTNIAFVANAPSSRIRAGGEHFPNVISSETWSLVKTKFTRLEICFSSKCVQWIGLIILIVQGLPSRYNRSLRNVITLDMNSSITTTMRASLPTWCLASVKTHSSTTSEGQQGLLPMLLPLLINIQL